MENVDKDTKISIPHLYLYPVIWKNAAAKLCCLFKCHTKYRFTGPSYYKHIPNASVMQEVLKICQVCKRWGITTLVVTIFMPLSQQSVVDLFFSFSLCTNLGWSSWKHEHGASCFLASFWYQMIWTFYCSLNFVVAVIAAKVSCLPVWLWFKVNTLCIYSLLISLLWMNIPRLFAIFHDATLAQMSLFSTPLPPSTPSTPPVTALMTRFRTKG